jgi:cellobiose-specific phosphotransferase system component IIC
MSEEPYKNREINEMFEDVQSTLGRIEEQTKKTNGRVTELEKWKYASMGATGILSVIVVPILAWALYTLVNINHDIHQAIDEALQAYSIQYEDK